MTEERRVEICFETNNYCEQLILTILIMSLTVIIGIAIAQHLQPDTITITFSLRIINYLIFIWNNQ